jgi:hypothetical protein
MSNSEKSPIGRCIMITFLIACLIAGFIWSFLGAKSGDTALVAIGLITVAAGIVASLSTQLRKLQRSE